MKYKYGSVQKNKLTKTSMVSRRIQIPDPILGLLLLLEKPDNDQPSLSGGFTHMRWNRNMVASRKTWDYNRDTLLHPTKTASSKTNKQNKTLMVHRSIQIPDPILGLLLLLEKPDNDRPSLSGGFTHFRWNSVSNVPTKWMAWWENKASNFFECVITTGLNHYCSCKLIQWINYWINRIDVPARLVLSRFYRKDLFGRHGSVNVLPA